MHDKKTQAVQASLRGDWEEAIVLNTEILAEHPGDISTLNRLGLAYSELDQKDLAKEVYTKVLALDKYNSVATRSLKNLSTRPSRVTAPLAAENFIEEPGLTRTAELIKVPGRDTLLALTCKECLSLVPRSRLIALQTSSGTTVGCLPDDLSLHLAKLLKNGYAYSVCVRSVANSSVSVFIRETKRPARITFAPTFSRGVKLHRVLKKARVRRAQA